MGCQESRNDGLLQRSEEVGKEVRGVGAPSYTPTQAADDLAKIGSKREAIPSNVFLEHIHTPSVQEDPFTEEAPQPKSATDLTEVEVPAVVDLIMEVLVITPDWTVPYIAYILRKELPENEEEARQIVR